MICLLPVRVGPLVQWGKGLDDLGALVGAGTA